jgi:hypothetical protein
LIALEAIDRAGMKSDRQGAVEAAVLDLPFKAIFFTEQDKARAIFFVKLCFR